jgi:hypothetical protein
MTSSDGPSGGLTAKLLHAVIPAIYVVACSLCSGAANNSYSPLVTLAMGAQIVLFVIFSLDHF